MTPSTENTVYLRGELWCSHWPYGNGISTTKGAPGKRKIKSLGESTNFVTNNCKPFVKWPIGLGTSVQLFGSVGGAVYEPGKSSQESCFSRIRMSHKQRGIRNNQRRCRCAFLSDLHSFPPLAFSLQLAVA